MVFPVVVYGCESWTIKKAEHQRMDAFELWCWRRLLRVSWTTRKSNQSILKEIRREYSLEGLMLKLKFQHFGHLIQITDSLERPDAEKDWRQEEKGVTEDKMVGWHHWLNGHELEQAPGVDDGQGSLVCYSPWGRKELDTTEWLNWTELNWRRDRRVTSFPTSTHGGKAMWTQAGRKPVASRNQLSPDTESGTLIFDFLTFRTMRNKCFLRHLAFCYSSLNWLKQLTIFLI